MLYYLSNISQFVISDSPQKDHLLCQWIILLYGKPGTGHGLEEFHPVEGSDIKFE